VATVIDAPGVSRTIRSPQYVQPADSGVTAPGPSPVAGR
jgi:hypothetical protein